MLSRAVGQLPWLGVRHGLGRRVSDKPRGRKPRDNPSLHPIKGGNRLARVAMIEAAWLWLRHQPDSAPTRWFDHRTQGQKGRIGRVMIVAPAGKLAIAFWRYLETGPIPEGAVVT